MPIRLLTVNGNAKCPIEWQFTQFTLCILYLWLNPIQPSLITNVVDNQNEMPIFLLHLWILFFYFREIIIIVYVSAISTSTTSYGENRNVHLTDSFPLWVAKWRTSFHFFVEYETGEHIFFTIDVRTSRLRLRVLRILLPIRLGTVGNWHQRKI